MKLQITGKSVQVILAALVLLAITFYVWPTQWMYHGGGVLAGDQVAPIQMRVHRFTGRVQYLTLDGFRSPTIMAPPAPVPAVPGPGMAPSVPAPD